MMEKWVQIQETWSCLTDMVRRFSTIPIWWCHGTQAWSGGTAGQGSLEVLLEWLDSGFHCHTGHVISCQISHALRHSHSWQAGITVLIPALLNGVLQCSDTLQEKQCLLWMGGTITYNPGQKCWDTCTFSLKIAPLRFPPPPPPLNVVSVGWKCTFSEQHWPGGRGDVTLRKRDPPERRKQSD